MEEKPSFTVTLSKTLGNGSYAITKTVTASFPDASLILLVSAKLWEMVNESKPEIVVPKKKKK